jgi:riboflavin synthase
VNGVEGDRFTVLLIVGGRGDRLARDDLGEAVDVSGDEVAAEFVADLQRFVLRAPPELSRFIAEKGSVCLDGTSLTVNGVEG